MSFRFPLSGSRAAAVLTAAVLGLGGALGLAAPVAAQGTPSQQPGQIGNAEIGQTYGDWTGACETVPGGARECYIFQTVTDSNSGRPMMSLKVGTFLPENRPAILADMPTGVMIQPGARFAVDGGEAVRVPYQICTPGLCRAVVPLNDQMIGKLKAGTKLDIGFVTAGGKEVGTSASLSGFTAGWEGAVN